MAPASYHKQILQRIKKLNSKNKMSGKQPETVNPADALAAIIGKELTQNAAWFASELRCRQRENFYGKVTLIFEDGRIVRIVEERIKLPPRS